MSKQMNWLTALFLRQRKTGTSSLAPPTIPRGIVGGANDEVPVFLWRRNSAVSQFICFDIPGRVRIAGRSRRARLAACLCRCSSVGRTLCRRLGHRRAQGSHEVDQRHTGRNTEHAELLSTDLNLHVFKPRYKLGTTKRGETRPSVP